ncbi:response regulator [Paenibacillus silvisoli]|uniref:response regulator n=1 Tax=Paenibacillus silvisoli TaxID=3110539 RepID=UPI00280447F3|nr:response regulator [Paenibacillus silvisoli]
MRNHLGSLPIWDKGEFYLCGEATNGEAALELIEELSPDIILSDVSMPVMNGVELAYQLSSRASRIPIIMLSSYDDYDFVRESLNHGAIDYLLKHRIDETSLLAALEKAKNKLQQHRRLQSEEEHKALQWKRINVLARQNMVKELLLGLKSPEEIEAFCRLQDIQFDTRHVVTAVMQIFNYNLLHRQGSEKDRGQFIKSVLDLIQQHTSGIVAHIDQGQFALLYSFEQLRSEAQIRQELQLQFETIQGIMSRFLNVQAVFGSGRPCLSLAEAPAAYRAVIGQMQERYLAAFNRSTSPAAGGEVIGLTIKQEKQLLGVLERTDEHAVGDTVRSIFESLASAKAGPDSYELVICEMLQIAHRVGQKFGIDSEKLVRLTALSKDRLGTMLEPVKLQTWMESVYGELTGLLRAGYASYSPYVMSAVQYIQANYRSNISLQQTAEGIGINASYLSSLFKKETGLGFVEYLNRKRVEVAQVMLGEGEKVKEVYAKAGFNNYNYFFKVFKEMTGMTPSVYERQQAK